MLRTIGKVPFHTSELTVRALSGVLADRDRNTSQHLSTQRNLYGHLMDVEMHTVHKDTIWIEEGGRTHRVTLGTNVNIPLRVGHNVTAYFAIVEGSDELRLVAFADDTMKQVYDLSGRVRLPGPKANFLLEFVLVTVVLGVLIMFIGDQWIHWAMAHPLKDPWGVHVRRNPHDVFFMCCFFLCWIPPAAYYAVKSGDATRQFLRWRTNLWQFIRSSRA
jgi:hypothetical protein